CVDCLDPLSCRNGFLCQIQMLHPPVLLISCDAYISYFAEFLYCLCQRGTVNAEPLRHLLRSRTRMSVKILHIELLAPADLKFRESPVIIHFHEPVKNRYPASHFREPMLAHTETPPYHIHQIL